MSNLQYIDSPYVLENQEKGEHVIDSKDLETDVKIPYVIKDKILMSPGVWNNYYYTAASIEDAYENSDWADGEVRALFLDHKDREAKEWVGEVRNQYFDGEDVRGDLYIVDKGTAMKLAFGAKMGISPKVTGEEEGGKMQRFLFDNFSVVINPAVKRAYINNSEMETNEMAKELDPKAKVRTRGDVVFDDKDPKVKDNKDHFPINNIRQARNALARVAQFESAPPWYDGSLEELQKKVKEAVKKKYPSIKVTGLSEEVDNMSEEDKKVATQEMEEAPSEEPKEAPEEAKEEAKEEAPIEEVPAEEAPKEEVPEAPAESELSDFTAFASKYMSENEGKGVDDALEAYNAEKEDPLLARIKALESAVAELKGHLAPKEEEVEGEKEMIEPEAIKEKDGAKELGEEVSEPEAVENSESQDETQSVTVENSEVSETLDKATEADPSKRSFYMSECDVKDADREMLNFLQSQQSR